GSPPCRGADTRRACSVWSPLRRERPSRGLDGSPLDDTTTGRCATFRTARPSARVRSAPGSVVTRTTPHAADALPREDGATGGASREWHAIRPQVEHDQPATRQLLRLAARHLGR